MNSKNIQPIRLRLELKNNYLSDFQKVMLKRYGESTTGYSIVREVLIPSDMPLHNLHYVIQKAFGWQNSHLRRFILPETIFQKVTKGTVKGWTDLVGEVFQPPSEGEEDVFWDDDFDSNSRSSFNAWLKRKYKGPYEYGGYYEHPEAAKEDVSDIVENPREFEIKESFQEYFDRKRVDEDAEIRVLDKKRLIDMTLEELDRALILENGTENLLERLLVDDVIGFHSDSLGTNGHFPLTHELIYNYDFGDNWEVFITKHENYSDLLDHHFVFEEELKELEMLVVEKHKPYCIHRDGLPVMDDVGGLGGFADFLGNKYEYINVDEYNSNLTAWATSMGWRPTKTVPREIL